MPNWVTNRLKFEGKGAKEALESHLTKDSNGDINFDFNTVDKMPEELNIEKGSRSTDGFKLAITKRCPHCRYYGESKDRYPDIISALNKNDFILKQEYNVIKTYFEGLLENQKPNGNDLFDKLN